jgi:hypothetical protein
MGDNSRTSLFSRIWISRLLIGLVTFFNLQCALIFLITPAAFAPSFELSGFTGQAVIASLGILFLMWNIPYLFALYHPVRYRTSLLQAVIMQAVGFMGETILWLNIPAGHEVLNVSILRFMVFDGLGLLALLAAFLVIIRSVRVSPSSRTKGA